MVVNSVILWCPVVVKLTAFPYPKVISNKIVEEKNKITELVSKMNGKSYGFPIKTKKKEQENL